MIYTNMTFIQDVQKIDGTALKRFVRGSILNLYIETSEFVPCTLLKVKNFIVRRMEREARKSNAMYSFVLSGCTDARCITVCQTNAECSPSFCL